MRSIAGFLLAFIACCAFCLNAAPPTTITDDAVNQTATTQARKALERWESSLTKDDLKWLEKSWNDCNAYLDAWATVDLDRTVKLEREHRNRGTQLRLAQRMAGARRWDLLEEFVDANAKYFDDRYLAAPFWSRVANYGAQLRDLNVVDLAGRRLEALAAAQPSEAGAPPRPSTEIVMARFYVAASRLHALRADQGWTNRTAAERKKTLAAADDLWRAAGAVVPQRSVFSAGPNVSGMRGFAALESWMPSSKDDFGFGPPPKMTFAGELVKELEAEASLVPRWPIGVTLPEIGLPVVSAWLERQVLLGRTEVALAAIWLAPGSDVDRARQLAVVARHLPDEQAELAVSLRAAADKSLQANDELSDSIVRALAELSLAHSASDQFEDATRCIDTAATAYPAGADHRSRIEYVTNDVVLQAIAALPDSHPLSESVLAFDANRRLTPSTLHQFRLHIDGLIRRVDLSRVVAKPLYQGETLYDEHAEYRRFIANKDWARALLEAERRAKGNPAWRTSFAQIGAESGRDISLAGTLEWCKQLSNIGMRLPAEIGAIREAIGNERTTLPVLNPTSTSFVAPTIGWPSGC